MEHIDENLKQEIVGIQEEIHLEKETNPEGHRHANFEGWILDPENTHIIFVLFNRTLDLY